MSTPQQVLTPAHVLHCLSSYIMASGIESIGGADKQQLCDILAKLQAAPQAIKGPKMWWLCDADNHDSGAVWTRQPDAEDIEWVTRETKRQHVAFRLVLEGAQQSAQAIPLGWVPLRIEWEPGHPEDVAFGPQIMMDRLKKWLDKHFANLQAAQGVGGWQQTKRKRASMNRSQGLGKTIRALRKIRCLTQAELAKRAGLERTSITNIESGKQILTETTIRSIADALGYVVEIKFKLKDTP